MRRALGSRVRFNLSIQDTRAVTEATFHLPQAPSYSLYLPRRRDTFRLCLFETAGRQTGGY
uniref:Uncharacterized protein n=1 Tax=Anguilla anguilla TaxID=7936 RepID=A0A0E9UED0_ANGAN